MRNFALLALSVLLFGCNQSDSTKTETTTGQQTDTSKTSKDSTADKKPDATASKTGDTTILITVSVEIFTAAKNRDYEKLARFIHPQKGVGFYPSSYIDTSAIKISATDFLALAKQKKKIDWGSGSAEPEKLTVEQYFGQFVYDRDYLKIGSRSVNDLHRGGTAEGFNVKEKFAGHDIVEYFFAGIEKNGNMDWSAVRLVFEWNENTPYLVGVVYDHWTP